MNETRIKEIVHRNFNEGFHCAESIANTMAELFPNQTENVCKMTSGFCGGIGKCKEDICGALSGSIIVLGSMYGREKGGEDISKLVSLSAELRNQFINEFDSTVCKEAIKNIEGRAEYGGCNDLTAKAAWMLHNLITKEQD